MTKAPEDAQLDALLDHALARKAHYPTFLLVQRAGAALSPAGKELLTALEEFLITSVESDRWPGTQLSGEKARVMFFHLERGAVNQLKHVGKLAAFVGPQMPEDLCILAADKTPWLASAARDGRFLLHLTDDERKAAQKALPWLQLEDDHQT
ncbi:MAG: hypothetical protein JST92_24045 [Deltaproteobacteria bacterium]|nr:hypothetical protein [Deltaproteobacteria bacterium]